MNDRELLEAAAKAAGYELESEPASVWVIGEDSRSRVRRNEQGGHSIWNPLTDDGDALRLAVALDICIEFGYCEDDAPVVYCGPVSQRRDWPRYANFPDPGAATRRAIVRAAAAIGRSYEGEGK